MKTDDDEETDDEMDTDDEEDDIYDILLKIASAFDELIDLREQYRPALPQLRVQKWEEMEAFLSLYAGTKAQNNT